jgi:mono/diheme cytochrome c family protein
MRFGALACACMLALGLGLAGCGGDLGGGGVVGATGDAANGKQLFVERCGSCHAMADAGTSGTIGPNMDDAFAGSRAQGFEESTFADVVRWQIAFPGIGLGMPADLVTGGDADDVATYVARYAGNPDIQPSGGGEITATEGSEIFTQAGCGSCHTLAAAGSSGAVGPNLDEAKPAHELVVDRVTNGQGAMPSFKDQLSEEQIQAVADFVTGSQ